MSKLREERIKHGYTLKQIGSMIGVSEASVSLYETGKREPSNDTLKFFADLYGVTVDYLLDREDRIQAEAEAIVEHYVNAQGGRPTGALAFSPNPINAARESIRKDADQFSPETMSVIESILAKLEQLDDADRKIAEEHIDFLLSRKKGE